MRQLWPRVPRQGGYRELFAAEPPSLTCVSRHGAMLGGGEGRVCEARGEQRMNSWRRAASRFSTHDEHGVEDREGSRVSIKSSSGNSPYDSARRSGWKKKKKKPWRVPWLQPVSQEGRNS